MKRRMLCKFYDREAFSENLNFKLLQEMQTLVRFFDEAFAELPIVHLNVLLHPQHIIYRGPSAH